MADTRAFANVAALGRWARHARQSRGLTLQALSNEAGVGIRFLSEFERGKETAELGKVLQALAAIGAGLAGVGADAPDSGDAGERPAGKPEIGPRPEGGGDATRLWDMLEAATEIEALAASIPDSAAGDAGALRLRALERCFDVLGEAARRVSPAGQARLSRIPWRALIARRNSLVLDYQRDHTNELLGAAREELPVLAGELRAALAGPGR
jgi:uncharacterized protein with HEPN domain